MAKTPEKVSEARKAVVDRIVSDMQTQGLDWKRMWSEVPSPYNPLTGTKYKGGNRLHLYLSGLMKEYSDPRWVTFNQAKKAGWHLEKGAKASTIEKWKVFHYAKKDGELVPMDPQEAKEQGLETKSFLRCVGYWNVFNAEQFSDAPELPKELVEVREMNLDEINEMADDFIASSRCKITETLSNEAYYTPTFDEIVVPTRTQFSNNEAFIETLWHEMVHSTSHDGTSATRTIGGNRFTDRENYAHEELIAELGSVFIASDMGLSLATDPDSEHYQSHVAYLQSWCKAISDDPSYLFKAAAMADKASEYLTTNYQEHCQQKEADKDLSHEARREVTKETKQLSLSERVASMREVSMVTPETDLHREGPAVDDMQR